MHSPVPIPTDHKANTRRDFQSSLIASLIACILLFLLFPQYQSEERNLIPKTPAIHAVDVMAPPPTMSRTPPPPPRPKIVLPDAPRIFPLPDLPSSIPGLVSSTNSGTGKQERTAIQQKEAGMAFPSLPQQILEVLPEDRDEECRGTVTLLITIGIDGKPQKHEIVSSTLAKDECMQRVLDAVYASRWESLPGTADERTYRIRKSYSFK